MRSLLPEGPPPRLAPAVDAVLEWWARRTPRARSILGVAGVLVLALLVAGQRGHPWGPTTSTWVATRTLPAGHVLTATDLRAQAWPLALLPDAVALDAPPAPGTRLAIGLPSGAVVTAGHVQGPTLADRAPAGHVVVAIPGEALPDMPVGAVVDLHGGDGVHVLGAVVLERTPDTAWLAVPRSAAGELARALAWGELLVGVVSTAG